MKQLQSDSNHNVNNSSKQNVSSNNEPDNNLEGAAAAADGSIVVESKPKIELRKEIGVMQGVGIIVGIIVGSGIFVSPKGILQDSKSVGLSFVMWTVTGLFSAMGAICYAELGTTIPRSGGEYIYVLQVLGPLPAFLVLWITFVAVGAVSTAANSLLFAKYCLTPLFVGCEVPEYLTRMTAFLSVSLLTAINCINVKWATKTAVVISICKVSALVIITVIGFYNFGKGRTENFENSFHGSDYGLGTISAFYQGFWAFAGWNYLNFLTEEMKRPSRSLPLAIIISLSLITVIYVTANLAYLAVLTPEELIASHAVAVTFAEKTMGAGAFVMPLFVAAAIFGSMNGEVLSMSRAAFTGAYEGHFPAALAMVNAKRLTPVPSVLFMFFFTLIFQQLFTNQLDYLIELTGFSFMAIILLAIGCLLVLRWKHPELPRTLKLPLAIPIVLFIITALICLITLIKSPKESAMSLIVMLTGLPFYLIGVVWKRKPASLQTKMDKLTEFVQKFLLVLPQEKPVD